MIWALIIVVGLFAIINMSFYAFTHQKKFGSLPQGARLERVKRSPNYRNDEFQNLTHTPQLSEGVNVVDIVADRFFGKHERLTPKDVIPSIKTDLKKLDPSHDVLIWLGHSSYFIQIDGKKILVDPVLCGYASPVSFMIKAFPGSDIYKAEDMPEVDYLIITHDHWDHLDYKTVTVLKDNIGKVVCGLGVGEHFQKWGFDMSRVVEMDWNDERSFDDFDLFCLPTRHFSGRSQKRNHSLWVSFLMKTPTVKIYIGGDGGYGEHFRSIGDKFGEIDIALLENGQYDQKWKYIHSLPEQVVEAAKDLRARSFVPGHSSKFALAAHPWDEPLKRISEAYEIEIKRIYEAATENDSKVDAESDYWADKLEANNEYKASIGRDSVFRPRLLTPMIGEPVFLRVTTQTFKKWWVGVE